MNVIPTQNVWFDDAATLAMGKAFDNACKSLQNFGSAVPAIIADLIIAGAKNGERDPTRLHEQAIIIFAIEDTSMPLASVGRDPPSQPTLRSRTQGDRREPGFAPLNRALSLLSSDSV
jgi:hypothetical protein